MAIKKKKIVIIGIAGLGNMLLFMPVLENIRRQYPFSKITLLTFQLEGDHWLVESDLVDDVMFFHWFKYKDVPTKEKILMSIQMVKAIVSLRLSRFDISIWPCVVNTSIKMEILSALIGAKMRLLHSGNLPILNHLVFMPPRTHLVVHNINLFRVINNEVTLPEEIRLPIQKEEIDMGKKTLDSLGIGNECTIIGFQPGGNRTIDPYRQWQPEKFATLGDRFCGTIKGKVKIFLFGSRSEKPLLDSIAAQAKHEFHVISDLSLREVAALISHFDLFIANDSGLMHLASAVGTRVLGILGLTDPQMTGPWGSRTHVIRMELPCSPCYVEGYQKHCLHHACLNELSADDVFSVALGLLKGDKNGSNTQKVYNIEKPEILPLAFQALSDPKRKNKDKQ